MRQTETENVGAQPPQAARPKLEADDKEQERDADLGHALDRFRLAEQPKHRGSDQRARDNVAEGRTEAEAAKQHHEEQSGAEQDGAVAEEPSLDDRCRVHRADSIAARSARNGSRIAPCRALRVRAGSSAVIPGHAAGSSSSLASQRLSASIASETSSCVRPRLCRSTSAAEACPNAQAWTCIDKRSTRRSSSSWTVRQTRLPQVGERTSAQPSSRSSGRGSLSDAASRRISVV